MGALSKLVLSPESFAVVILLVKDYIMFLLMLKLSPTLEMHRNATSAILYQRAEKGE